MALLDLFVVAKAARGLFDARYNDEDCKMVVTAMKKAGLSTYASLRIGFPRDPASREKFVRGWCDEIGLTQVDLAVAMVLGSLDLSLGACSSPMVVSPGMFAPKRLHGGSWVEAGDPTLRSVRCHRSPVASSSEGPCASPPGVGAGPARLSALPEAKAADSRSAASCLASVSASLVATSDSVPCFPPPPPPESPLLSKQYTALLVKDSMSIARLFAFLGSRSSVHTEMYGTGGSLKPSPAVVSTCNDLLIGTRKPGCVSSYVKECFSYFEWAEALNLDVCSMGVLMICSYLRSACERGRSVPNLARCALVWCEVCTRTSLGTNKREITAFVTKLTVVSPSGMILKAPVQARPVPPDSVCALELLVTSGHTLPIRVFAGVAALCCHGVKRWSDVQHVTALSVTDDALLVTTWRSKKKRAPLLWAALRRGFSNTDWVMAFMLALKEAHLPGPDYLVRRPSRDLKCFTSHPASWADACRCVQAALVVTGLSAESACSYTMHSFRHVYPTVANQLGMQPEVISLMGHWATSKDKMASAYDGARTATELLHKSHVCRNVAAGWRPAPTGSIPKPPVIAMGLAAGVTPLAEPARLSAANLCILDASTAVSSAASASVPASTDDDDAQFTFPKGIVQVLNSKTSTVHLSPAEGGTFCKFWKCGRRKTPARNAEFARSTRRWKASVSVCRFCITCHSSSMVHKFGGRLKLNGVHLDASSGSRSESVASISFSNGGE